LFIQQQYRTLLQLDRLDDYRGRKWTWPTIELVQLVQSFLAGIQECHSGTFGQAGYV